MEVADILNARGLRPGAADRFNIIIYHIRQQYRLENRFSRLRRQGMLTLQEMTAALGLDPSTVKNRTAKGHLVAHVYNDKGQRLYMPAAEPAMIACLYCGKLTPERGKHGQWQKYCSARCCTRAHARRRTASGWVRVRRRAC